MTPAMRDHQDIVYEMGLEEGAEKEREACLKIIEEHEGKIDVESGDQGTTFTITLPLGRGKKVKSG